MDVCIAVYVDKDDLESLNHHTQASPFSRSELIGVAIRRFLREERRRATPPRPEVKLAQRVATGEIPSRAVDGTRIARRGAPWAN